MATTKSTGNTLVDEDAPAKRSEEERHQSGRSPGSSGEEAGGADPDEAQSGGSSRTLGEQASRIVQDVREMGEIARTATGDKLTTGKEQLGSYEEHLLSYVRSNPVKSMLLAAGTGALIALLARRG